MKRIIAILVVLMAVAAAGCGYKPTGIILAPTMAGNGGTPVPGKDVSGTPAGAGTDTPAPTKPEDTTATPVPTEAPTETPVPTSTPTPTVTPTPEAVDPANDGKIVVVLDPGHGGIWTGAVSGNYVEAAINLKIGHYCLEYIREHYPQIEVYMTRTEDKTFSNDLPTDLLERILFAKAKNADVLVSLHLNASGSGNASGCLICTQHRDNVKDNANRLGSLILERLEALGIKSRAMSNGVRQGLYIRYSGDHFDDKGNPLEYYQICRNAANEDLVGIIVEHCFIDSASDSKYFATEDAIRALAEADAKGIAAYFGLE